jgi:GNAT superfamily N-acetyltransferase
MAVEIKILSRDDESLLLNSAPGVFDNPVEAQLAWEFLQDARHHIAAAVENGQVVGFASAVHYLHPDKRPQLWINEVTVAPTHRQQGLGKALLTALFDVGRQLGCTEAWVLTDRPNQPAMRLYSSLTNVPPTDHVMFTFPL